MRPSRTDKRKNRRLRLTKPSLVAVILVFVMSCVAFAASSAPAPRKRSARSFVIYGTLARPLQPGDREAVQLTVRNRRGVPLRIISLKIFATVDRAHAADGCLASRDFTVKNLPRSAFPIRLAPKRRGIRRLAKRVVISPVLAMRDLSGVNQDACKGAQLKLGFRGRAVVLPHHRSKVTSGIVTSR